ncbi:ribonuclease Z [Methanimicrococcus blatticola]|uniref:Ribonuclease Z n=1 Tax=Methanimicrococcus blatticola TaxID=91560 RepID=A0A484F6J1_9EURY|nr:ribonuclease Z [Methanimicrococcus blatticola]MBZ3934982.1 ribonuclease Z [Methanimicrococcus blatticola]MCC2508920.1 ribonuclease Z [Methanimicrococcus blatticola]TDQ71053.1 RNAse Z [Methanimicrococcus blatticola]
MLKITFLGTGGALPSKERNPAGIMVNREGELLLFDCGEGSQRQMMTAKTGLVKISAIFLSHYHGDHILGLPGLLQTMGFFDREEKLEIYGPDGLFEVMEAFEKLGTHKLQYQIILKTLAPGDIVQRNGYIIKAVRADHDRPALGFILEEEMRPGRFNREKAIELGVEPGPNFAKLHRGENVTLKNGTVVYSKDVVGPMRPGRKIAYSGDTRETDVFFYESEGADLVIHEATFTSEMEQQAYEYGHSTAKGAAKMAKKYNIRKLILTHLSPRLTDEEESVLADAKSEFENVSVAEDLMEIDVELRDE